MSERQEILALGLGVPLTLVAIVLVVFFRPPSEPPPTVRLGYLNITASLPLFIAEEKRYFEKEGLQTETYQVASSNLLVNEILADNIDIIIEASALSVLSSEFQSPGKFKVFSASSLTAHAPFDALLVNEESRLTTLKDLAGKRIGVLPGSTPTKLLKKFLADNAIDVLNISFVPTPPQDHVKALLDQSVDAVHTSEPTIAIALARGGIRVLYGSVYAEILDRNPQGVAVISSKFIRDDPRTAGKVIRALERAMVFMREHETESREILEQRLGLPPEVARRSVFFYMLPHSEIEASVFQKYSDMLAELGEIEGKVNVDGLLYRD